MGLPKRKTNIKVYGVNSNTDGPAIVGRRKELLEDIIKSDTYLPDSILHDDLDLGMLEFVKENFKVNSDGDEIPVVPKILTIQRWAEYTNNWSFSDDDGNIKLPFIAVVRRPDVQFGTNPSIQRTIPDRRDFFYASVPTWDGNQMGADIYKIPQPIAVDISFDVTIVCTKFRDVNKFNQKVLQKFSSRQSYTKVKGHYIPIVLDRIEDNTPMDTMDGRRFYIQNYSFTMLGFLIDDEEFDVSPAIARSILMTEVDTRSTKLSKKSNPITITSTYLSGSIVANYTATAFLKVDKTIKISFNDVLNKTNGDTVVIPVDIFIDTNQISGTTQYTVVGDYSGLTYTNSFSGITIDSIGKTKYNFDYETSSFFEPQVSPTPTPTPTLTVTPSVTSSVTPSITPTPSITESVTPSITPSITPTLTVTPSVTSSVTPSITPTPSITESVTPSITPTPSITESVTPSITPTPTRTLTPTVTPTPSTTPSIVSSGLVIQLDAYESSSYPGTGTTVFDITGGYDHTLIGATYTVLNGIKCFDCTTGNNRVNYNLTGPTLPNSGYTYITWARLIPSNTVFRTLLYANGATKITPITIPNASNELGYWATGFVGSEYDVSSLAGVWVQFAIVGTNSSQTFYINGSQVGSTIASGAGGTTHWGWGNNDIVAQPWGHIANMYFYNRQLSLTEITQQYNYLAPRFVEPTPTQTLTPTSTITPTVTPTPSTTPNAPVTSNLVLYYDPSNSSSYPGSGTTINDLSGNGLNGSMSGITFTTPYFSYNGTSSQIRVADNTLLEPGSGDWTIEVWVNQAVSGNDVVIGKFDNGGLTVDVSYSIRTTNTTYYAQLGSGSGSGSSLFVDSTNYVGTIDTWYQIVYVFTNVASNTLQTFVNGVSIGSVGHSLASILNTANPLYIGSYNGGEYAQWFHGKIGITRLYNASLTSSQVLQNFNADKSKYGL
jgi:hypothetical protein